MPALSEKDSERARKSHSTILKHLSSVGQARLAEELSVSEPTISRWKTEQLEFCVKALAILGLKVVPIEMRCFDPKKIDAILNFARDHVNSITSESLAWDE